MLTDRGVAPGLRADELDVRWFGGCDWLHLSGYALVRRPIDEAAAKAAGAAQAQGGRLSVDLASASGIAAYGPERLLEPARAARARRRVRERGRARGARRERSGHARRQARRRRLRRRRAARYDALPGARSSTRPAPATRSRPASSSAAPSSPREAAARCVAQLGAMP